MAMISVQHVVVLLLTSFLIAITFFLFTSDNIRFPLPSLSSDYTPLPNSSNLGVSSDQTPQKMKMKLNASHDQEEEVVKWDLCKGAESVDYIPCLDNRDAIKQLKSRRHMEHRERHCPEPTPKCLVPLPDNYKPPVPWPKSRDMVWYNNVPHPKLVEYKKEQNWVKKEGEFLVFPGGGTQFKYGVTHYVEFIEKALPVIKWGKNIRVVLDVGCGVASFGGFLLDKDVITMSFAPKDEHEAQIQFALERGIPATLSVIGTQQLTFPANAFDLIHCARCRVHWDADGGKPLLELNRVLRPGGFFIWSATPVYRDNDRDSKIWTAMVSLTKSICWKVVAKMVDSSGIGLVIYQKPTSESCYKKRSTQEPPLCPKEEANASWYAPLRQCISKLPSGAVQKWPELWPKRLGSVKPQSVLVDSKTFKKDTEKWSEIVSDVYLERLAVNWSSVRNVMDMNAGFGGFAAALVNRPLWVMNVVPVDKPDTLSVVFDRGLIGVYHDWCESLNTYPRTYDLLHSSFYLGDVTQRCEIVQVVAEIDRVLRPGGYLVVQDTMETIKELESILGSLHWSTKIHQDRFLVGRKGFWRPIKPEL
ncbi:hypothetical protein HID58_052250 [Brassica napus]|nr:probable methyltransferase PMT23 [Brassica napus]KAH0889821.1 hypothetical protein HID58_052250 [Brassica napus]CAF1700870.1 unnamed protein product [Brassica napus]